MPVANRPAATFVTDIQAKHFILVAADGIHTGLLAADEGFPGSLVTLEDLHRIFRAAAARCRGTIGTGHYGAIGGSGRFPNGADRWGRLDARVPEGVPLVFADATLPAKRLVEVLRALPGAQLAVAPTAR